MSGLIELARFQTGVEADLARLLLESHGLEVVLFDVGMSHMGLGAIMPVRLMVLPSEAEAAAAVLVDEGLL